MTYSISRTLNSGSATIGLLAVIVFTALLIPIALFHELGHIVVCNTYGGMGTLTSISSGICFGDGENIALMRFAGGAFGMAGSLIPLAWWKRLKNDPRYRGILVGILALAVWEFEKAVVESSSYEFYTSYYGSATLFFGALASALFLFFVLNQKSGHLNTNPGHKGTT